MIAVDTNILLRYFAQDGGDQSAQATRLVEEMLSAEVPGFISHIVLCEMIWVMRRAYRQDRAAIAAFVEGLLAAPQFAVEESSSVELALAQEGQGISDVLLHEVGRLHGCSHTTTFDRKFAQMEGVELLAQ